MKYRNKKTGFMFETTDEIVGEDWEKLSPDTTNKQDESTEESDEEALVKNKEYEPDEVTPEEDQEEIKPKRRK